MNANYDSDKLSPLSRQKIPYVKYRWARGETTAEYFARIAEALSFAFSYELLREPENSGFEAESDTLIFPDGVLSAVKTKGAVRMVRDKARLSRSGADQLFITILRSGTVDIQPTRSGKKLVAGDIFILDLAREAKAVDSDKSAFTIVISRTILPDHLRVRDLHGYELRKSSVLADTIATLAAHLHAKRHSLSMIQATAMFKMIVDLLCLAMMEGRGFSPIMQTSLSAKTAAEALIEENLADPHLSPTIIAQRLNISRATLYRTFQKLGGVRSFIKARRMEAAWTILTTSDQLDVQDLADRCGYLNPDLLARDFKSRFGLKLQSIFSLDKAQQAGIYEQSTRNLEAAWRQKLGFSATPTPADPPRFSESEPALSLS